MDYQEEKMTLDEAITHARDVAERNRRAMNFESSDSIDDDIKVNCIRCAEQHEQLAEWLEELKQYRAIGNLEEVRDAVEKQKYCKHCGYKIHSNNINKLNSCNNCGLKSTCKKRPDYGEYCRINCYDWSEEK